MGWARERGPRPINPLILREETVAEPYDVEAAPKNQRLRTACVGSLSG